MTKQLSVWEAKDEITATPRAKGSLRLMRCSRGLFAGGCNAADGTTQHEGRRSEMAGLSNVMRKVEAQTLSGTLQQQAHVIAADPFPRLDGASCGSHHLALTGLTSGTYSTST